MPLDADRYIADTARRATPITRKRRKALPPPKTGDRSGNLTVVKFNPVSRYCECHCDCGKTAYVEAYRITRKITLSCGCKRRTS
jgi:hypothetical protein